LILTRWNFDEIIKVPGIRDAYTVTSVKRGHEAEQGGGGREGWGERRT